MNKNLIEMWDETEATGERICIGNIVVCDFCNDDYTDSDKSGGFVFSSYGTCPKCAERMEAEISKCGESRYIVARCKEGQSFADFIREYRGDNNYIQVSRV